MNLDSLMMSVLFTSGDGKINYSIHCKKTDIFSEIEKSYMMNSLNIKIKIAFFCKAGKLLIKMRP